MTTTTDQSAVVVGVDGSDSALGAARWAADFAGRHALPLVLVHASPRLDWSSGDAAGVLGSAETAVRSEHPELEMRTAEAEGSVAAVLAEASQTARLLAVGTGSHAIRIVHRAQCPVVVWRAPVAKRTGKPLPVVVGVDESDASTRAPAEAFDIAARLHAPLTIAHMWEIGAAVGMGDLGGQGNMDWQLLDHLQSRQRQQMDELVAPFAREYRNAHVTKVFQDLSPAKGLTDLSREAQLVVVGSHGRGRLADAILGSVSQNLIHHAECPVLVVH